MLQGEGMRTIGCFLLVVLGVIWAGAEPPAVTNQLSGTATNPVLSAEQIATLKTDAKDEKSGKTYQFTAIFLPKTLTDTEKEAYRKSGKIPFRVNCDLMESRMEGEKKITTRVESGIANFYVMDEKGHVVDSKTLNLGRWHPS